MGRAPSAAALLALVVVLGACTAANPLATPNFICFEPMAGITDAMNLSQKGIYKEQQYIAPNQAWEASFWVKPSGF